MSSDSFHPEQLKPIFSDFHKLHILVVGDLILDHYLWGNVSRISPEAPVPVVNVTRHENRLGGAGNVAANLAALNCRVSMAGVCGADADYRRLQQLLESQKIQPLIQSDKSRRTTVKSRIIAQHQQLVRIDEENTTELSAEMSRQLLDKIQRQSDQFDGIILSDYAKGLLGESLIQSIRNIFPEKPVIVDPKGYRYQKYAGVTAISPNRQEFLTAVHHPELSDEDLDSFAQKLVDELELQGLIVTLGEDGVFILDDRQQHMLIPTDAREVYDVSGAGDTFIATFTAALIASRNWFTAAKAANLAAGIVVGKVGTATATVEEIFEKYKI